MKLFIALILCIYCSGTLHTQCANIYFLRTKGAMQSDLNANIFHDGRLIFTVNKGQRYKINMCDIKTHSFSSSTSADALGLFSRKNIQLEDGKNYYIKVSVLLGLDEPVLTLMKEEKGKNLLAIDKKFTSAINEITIGETKAENSHAVSEDLKTEQTFIVNNSENYDNKQNLVPEKEAPHPKFIDDFWADVNINVKDQPNNGEKYDIDQLIVAKSGLILLSDNYYGPHTYSLDNGNSWHWGDSRWSFKVPFYRDTFIMTRSSLEKMYYSTSNFTDYKTHKPEYTEDFGLVSRLHRVILYDNKYYLVDDFELKEIRNLETLKDMTNDHFDKKKTSFFNGVSQGSGYRIIHHLNDNTVSYDYKWAFYEITKNKEVNRIEQKSGYNPMSFTYVKEILECDNEFYILDESGHGYMKGKNINNFKIVPDFVGDFSRKNTSFRPNFLKTGCPFIVQSKMKLGDQYCTLFKKINSNKWVYTDEGTNYLRFNPTDGYIYALKVTEDRENYKLVKSRKKFKCDCSEELFLDETESAASSTMKYGTTVITHGVMPPGVINYSDENWVKKMARAILDKAENGIIYYCEADNGKLEIVRSKGENPKEGEKIVLFDWAKYSLLLDPIYAEMAAEKLYLSLVHLNDIALNDVHFIGEGFGAIVNTLSAEKLAQLDNKNISIDQITHIAPREYSENSNQIKVWNDIYTDVYQSEYEKLPFKEQLVFEIAVEYIVNRISKISKKSGKVATVAARIIDELMGYETYFEATSVIKDIELVSDLLGYNDKKIAFTSLKEAKYAASFIDYIFKYNERERIGIILPFKGADHYILDDVYGFFPDGYTQTVRNAQLGEPTEKGYAFSRLNQGTSYREKTYGQKFSNYTLETGILNGKLRTHFGLLPAWMTFKTELESNVKVYDSGILIHEPMYFPENANFLTFRHRGNGNLKDGTITIDFYDVGGNLIPEAASIITIDADYISIKQETISIDSSMKGKVGSFSIFFDGNPFDENRGEAAVIIDEVKLLSDK